MKPAAFLNLLLAHRRRVVEIAFVFAALLFVSQLPTNRVTQAQNSNHAAQSQLQLKDPSVTYPTLYRTTQIDGLSIFYREAGPKDAPTILLLHGLPSSSRMFEPLFARLSDR